MRQALLYQKDTTEVTCTACKWYCRIPTNMTGVCGVRLNKNNRLYLLSHSLVSASHIDPIEKKPLYHFLPGSRIYSIGTYGCNFGCDFCQNWEISQSPKMLKADLGRVGNIRLLPDKVNRFIIDNSYKLSPQKIVDDALQNHVPSIAFTYNEPTIFAEYACDTMKIAKKHKLYGVFVSSGYESKETMDLLEGYIDAYNIDIKGGTEEFYRRYCHTKLSHVFETVAEIHRRKKWLEITTLLIPQLNTDNRQLKTIAKYIHNLSPDIPWHVTSFYPQYKMMDVPATPLGLLEKAYAIGKEVGLRFVYTGNIPNGDMESTRCPRCNTLLIERSGYQTHVICQDAENGSCGKCGEKIPGIWK